MKNLWEKIKAWLLAKWTAIKTWLLTKWTVLKAWLKKNWFMLVNYLVIVLAYNNVFGKDEVVFTELLLGLWIFISIAFAGWKWFNKPKK